MFFPGVMTCPAAPGAAISPTWPGPSPISTKRAHRFMNSENSDSWGANGLGYWLSPILLWDVSAAKRVDEYVEDFLEKAFGPAREPMREFYRLLNLDRSLRTPEDVVGRMYRSLEAARELADTPAVRAVWTTWCSTRATRNCTTCTGRPPGRRGKRRSSNSGATLTGCGTGCWS